MAACYTHILQSRAVLQAVLRAIYVAKSNSLCSSVCMQRLQHAPLLLVLSGNFYEAAVKEGLDPEMHKQNKA